MSKANPDKSFGHRFWVMVRESSYRDFTQAKLGTLFGVQQTTISEWMLGHKKPGLALGDQLCKTFRVNFDWLYTGRGPIRPRDEGDDPYTVMARTLSHARLSHVRIVMSLLNELEHLEKHTRSEHTRIVMGLLDRLDELTDPREDLRSAHPPQHPTPGTTLRLIRPPQHPFVGLEVNRP